MWNFGFGTFDLFFGDTSFRGPSEDRHQQIQEGGEKDPLSVVRTTEPMAFKSFKARAEVWKQ